MHSMNGQPKTLNFQEIEGLFSRRQYYTLQKALFTASASSHHQVQYFRAKLLFRLRQLQPALDKISYAVSKFPLNPQLFMLRAKILNKMKNQAAAIIDLKKCLELQPEMLQAKYLLEDLGSSSPAKVNKQEVPQTSKAHPEQQNHTSPIKKINRPDQASNIGKYVTKSIHIFQSDDSGEEDDLVLGEPPMIQSCTPILQRSSSILRNGVANLHRAASQKKDNRVRFTS